MIFTKSEIQKRRKNGNKKCDYCEKEYDESYFGTLDNGSDACLKCIEDEEKRMKKAEERIKENKEKQK